MSVDNVFVADHYDIKINKLFFNIKKSYKNFLQEKYFKFCGVLK